ncbi:DUF3267 domain-containing protein [[Brevibacterium] frigoritolerans]|uniref:DUF3267 domain-containing protein n=1 Tax=Peribacillus frigoritolerans TaxID=450367 RepID=A0A941FLG2_9BACI|nr:DUF3267 domain-containing protein [Peribacillus frigoritolerans]
MKTSWSLKWNLVLTCRVNVHDPIRKHLYLLTLVLPFVIMSVTLIGCALSFPHYIHYFTILLSLHTRLMRIGFYLYKNLIGSQGILLSRNTSKDTIYLFKSDSLFIHNDDC